MFVAPICMYLRACYNYTYTVNHALTHCVLEKHLSVAVAEVGWMARQEPNHPMLVWTYTLDTSFNIIQTETRWNGLDSDGSERCFLSTLTKQLTVHLASHLQRYVYSSNIDTCSGLPHNAIHFPT